MNSNDEMTNDYYFSGTIFLLISPYNCWRADHTDIIYINTTGMVDGTLISSESGVQDSIFTSYLELCYIYPTLPRLD